MKVLYFSHGFSPHDRRFLSKMVSSRHEIFFVRLDDDGAALDPCDVGGVQTVRWNGLGSVQPTPASCLAAMPRFSRLIGSMCPDVVHAGPIPTCAFMAALAGARPLLSMSWGSDILVDAKEDEVVRWAAVYALNRSDRFIVDCDAVRQAIQELGDVRPAQVVQFPWGLDLARFPAVERRFTPQRDILVLSTRSWAPIYGIETALDAFRQAAAQEPRLRLVLIGDGPLGPEVRRRVRDSGLGDRIRLPGRVSENELSSYFRQADLYLSCALSDGASVSLLEAMAFGLPVIVTDVPGNREWVESGRGGWIASPGDSMAFAEAILKAVRLHPDERHRISVHNRALVEARADFNSNVAQLINAYDELAAVGRPSVRPQEPSALPLS